MTARNEQGATVHIREWQQTLLDVTNALADSISNTHPYAKIVDQARRLLRETADAVDASVTQSATAPASTEELRAAIHDLRVTLGAMPITHCNPHPDLQAWFDKKKAVLAWTDHLTMTADERSAYAHKHEMTDLCDQVMLRSAPAGFTQSATGATFPRLLVRDDVVWLQLAEHDLVNLEALASGDLSQRARQAVIKACQIARSDRYISKE